MPAMGPGMRDITAEVERYRRAHPDVIIRSPADAGGKWEVSLPDSAAMAFDDPAVMLRALASLNNR